MLDREWRFTCLNRSALREMGQPAEALLGRTIWEVYPELLATDLEAQFRRALAEGVVARFEIRGVFSDRWFEVHAYPSPDGLTVHGRDVSGRRRAEEALRQSEEHFRQLAEAIDGVFWMVDADYQELLYVSPAYERVWGRSCRSLYDDPRSFLDGVHPEDRARVVAAMWQPFHERAMDEEYRVVRPDGSVVWVRDRGFAIRDAAGRVYRRGGLAEDVTARRLLEAALRESEQRFRQFMDNGPAVAWIKDEQGRHLYVNRRFEQEHGMPPEAVRGRDAFALFPPEVARQFHASDQAVLEADRPLEFAETAPGPGGSTRRVRVYKFPFRDAAGTRYIGGMAVDVTAQRQAEEQLREYAGRLLGVQEQERRHLARELHDEVGQLLTGLKLTLEAGAQLPAAELPESLGAALALVQELTARVRDISLRLRPSMLDDLGLVAALLWLFERYTAQTQVQVNFEHRGPERRFPPEVETAAYRIVQEALTNVARHAGVGACHVRLWLDDPDALHVQVEDRGAGFDPASARGASTGLSGMEERVVLVGGTLRLESAPGAGTRVVAELPVGPVGSRGDAGP